jgi:hypothetical protein
LEVAIQKLAREARETILIHGTLTCRGTSPLAPLGETGATWTSKRRRRHYSGEFDKWRKRHLPILTIQTILGRSILGSMVALVRSHHHIHAAAALSCAVMDHRYFFCNLPA